MTAMIDWNQCRMFYYPPSLSIGEMRCSLPCHRDLWDAANATTYIVQKENLYMPLRDDYSPRKDTISEFTYGLTADEWDTEERLSALNITLDSLSAATLGT